MGAPQYEQAGADIGGTGTTNTIPRWTGPSTLGDSLLIQTSNAITMTSTVNARLDFGVRNLSGGGSAYSQLFAGNDTDVLAGLLRNSSVNAGYAGPNSLNLWTVGAYPIGFVTANQLRAIVDASGNVGIGTATPNSTAGIGLTIYQAAAGSLYLQNATDIARIFQQPTNLYIDSSVGSASGSIIFRRGSTVTESARIDSAGRLLVGTTGTPSSGAVRVVVAANSGGQQWHSQGLGGCAVVASANAAQWYVYPGANVGSEGYLSSVKLTETGLDVTTASATPGIKLPATPGNTDPNTLDCYADGGTANSGGVTWTPTLKFGGATTGITYSTQVGRYTRIGNMVFATMYIVLTSKGSATGSVTIDGLPLSVNLAGFYASGTIGYVSAISFADAPFVYMGGNSTVLTLTQTVNAGTISAMTDANFSNTSALMISIAYPVT